MAKAKRATDSTILIECPGCKSDHGIDARWTFNNDFNKPTFVPSLHVHYKLIKGEYCCHSFVTDGKIQFLSDTTHWLSGQTVDLPDYL
jgi:hypothetical protein